MNSSVQLSVIMMDKQVNTTSSCTTGYTEDY